MRYVVINPTSMRVEVRTRMSSTLISIPPPKKAWLDGNELFELVHMDVIYATRQRLDAKQGIRAWYKLPEPDQWLLAMGAVMWEGIVQGLAWDAIKMNVSTLIRKLRRRRLAPGGTSSRSSRIRFSYVTYADDGKKQKEMYLEIKRAHRSMSAEERESMARALRPGVKRRKSRGV